MFCRQSKGVGVLAYEAKHINSEYRIHFRPVYHGRRRCVIRKSRSWRFAHFLRSLCLQLNVSPDLGQTTIILNVLLIFLQMLLLRKRYRMFQLVQFPVVFLFGYFIDLIMKYSDWMVPATYAEQAALCLLSCVVLGIGVFFEIKAALTYLPGEGLAMALTQTFGVEFGKTKIGTDSSLVVLGIASSLFFLDELAGIREGTVVAAVLVGYIVRFLHTRVFLFERWLKVRKKKQHHFFK